MGNTLGNPSTQNMNATDVKNANAMASGNRLNAARIKVGYSLSSLNICFKYRICLRGVQKTQPSRMADQVRHDDVIRTSLDPLRFASRITV